MGVDNEAVYVFGTYVPTEAVGAIEEQYGELGWCDDAPEELMELYPNLYIGNASPYYCADSADCTYYISMREPNDLVMTIEQTVALIDDWQNDTSGKHLQVQYRKFLEQFGIPYTDPTFWASPNVY